MSRRSGPGIRVPFILDGVALSLKEQVYTLGILLHKQVAVLAKRTPYQLWSFPERKQLWSFPERKDLTSVVYAQVTSSLDYCNLLCRGLSLRTVWKLQLVQNAAANLLCEVGHSDFITPLSAHLH